MAPWTFHRGRVGLFGLSYLVLGMVANPVQAAPVFNISFYDPSAQFAQYYSPLRTDIRAAGAAWMKDVAGNGSIDIQVRFDDGPTMASYSATSAYVRNNGPIAVYEQGMMSKLRTQIDPNGAAPDAIITIGRTYLTNELWLDPNPSARTAPVPTNKTDAESALLHEFGHMLGFAGWRNNGDGSLNGNYESTYDALVALRGGELYFTGAHAEAVYGGPVPLTSGNYVHVGNLSPLPGSNLILDLMNGVEFYRGTRYSISSLDLAMMEDIGAPLTTAGLAGAAPRPAGLPGPADVGEPAAVAFLLPGLLLVWGVKRTRGSLHPEAGGSRGLNGRQSSRTAR